MSSSQMCCSIWRWNGSFWWHWSGQVFLPTCQPIQNKPTMLLFFGRKEKRRRLKWKNQIGVVLTGSLLYRGSQNFSKVYRNLTLSRASLAKSVILLSCSCHCFNKNYKNSHQIEIKTLLLLQSISLHFLSFLQNVVQVKCNTLMSLDWEACKTPSTAFTSGPLIWSRR